MLDGIDRRLEPVLDVVFSVLAVQRDLRGHGISTTDSVGEETRISMTELAVLWTVDRAPSHQLAIAEALHLDKTTVNVAVRRLRDAEGWLAMTPDGLVLTSDGARALSRAETGLLAAVAQLVGRSLTARELRTVRLLARWLRQTKVGVRVHEGYRRSVK